MFLWKRKYVSSLLCYHPPLLRLRNLPTKRYDHQTSVITSFLWVWPDLKETQAKQAVVHSSSISTAKQEGTMAKALQNNSPTPTSHKLNVFVAEIQFPTEDYMIFGKSMQNLDKDYLKSRWFIGCWFILLSYLKMRGLTPCREQTVVLSTFLNHINVPLYIVCSILSLKRKYQSNSPRVIGG